MALTLSPWTVTSKKTHQAWNIKRPRGNCSMQHMPPSAHHFMTNLYLKSCKSRLSPTDARPSSTNHPLQTSKNTLNCTNPASSSDNFCPVCVLSKYHFSHYLHALTLGPMDLTPPKKYTKNTHFSVVYI